MLLGLAIHIFKETEKPGSEETGETGETGVKKPGSDESFFRIITEVETGVR